GREEVLGERQAACRRSQHHRPADRRPFRTRRQFLPAAAAILWLRQSGRESRGAPFPPSRHAAKSEPRRLRAASSPRPGAVAGLWSAITLWVAETRIRQIGRL